MCFFLQQFNRSKPSLTFRNSTFCPHCEFMCFVWVWEHTATISLYNINWLVFIREYVPPGLTLTYSTFCPHIVFMCCVWISERRAIIFLYSIKWLVFLTGRECVYCAVPTECLNIIQVNLTFWRLSQSDILQIIWLVTQTYWVYFHATITHVF